MYVNFFNPIKHAIDLAIINVLQSNYAYTGNEVIFSRILR